MAMYVYDIGKISVEPQGAAETVPSGLLFSGVGMPLVATFKSRFTN